MYKYVLSFIYHACKCRHRWYTKRTNENCKEIPMYPNVYIVLNMILLSIMYLHISNVYLLYNIFKIFIHITYAIYTVYIYILYNICIYTWKIDKRRISYIQQTPVHSKIVSGSRHPKHPTLCRVYKPNWWGYDHPLYGEPPAIYIRY